MSQGIKRGSWQCRSCMKQVENKDPNFFDDAFGMPICDECVENAKKTRTLRIILNPETEVEVLSEIEV